MYNFRWAQIPQHNAHGWEVICMWAVWFYLHQEDLPRETQYEAPGCQASSMWHVSHEVSLVNFIMVVMQCIFLQCILANPDPRNFGARCNNARGQTTRWCGGRSRGKRAVGPGYVSVFIHLPTLVSLCIHPSIHKLRHRNFSTFWLIPPSLSQLSSSSRGSCETNICETPYLVWCHIL